MKPLDLAGNYILWGSMSIAPELASARMVFSAIGTARILSLKLEMQ
jgi:hypothetical protein